ncbi:MAG: hypothetical protein LBF60_00595 [Treponema sp.]|jgi:hypothetical protein|nr:hypothetical protein [Treponema sp.]
MAATAEEHREAGETRAVGMEGKPVMASDQTGISENPLFFQKAACLTAGKPLTCPSFTSTMASFDCLSYFADHLLRKQAGFYLQEAQLLDIKRWNRGIDQSASVNSLKTWLTDRITWLDTAIPALQ